MRLRFQFCGVLSIKLNICHFLNQPLELKTVKHLCGYTGCLVTYLEEYIQESAYI